MDFIESEGLAAHGQRDVIEAVEELLENSDGNVILDQPVILTGASEEEGSQYDSDDQSSEDESEYERLRKDRAQEEWDESMRQLEGLFHFLVIPIVGKFFGRRFSYYSKSYNGQRAQKLANIVVWRKYVDWSLS